MTVGECKKLDLSGCLNAKQRRIMAKERFRLEKSELRRR
jgi:hypothetical protein